MRVSYSVEPRYKTFIGREVVDHTEKAKFGTITDVLKEGNLYWFVINDDFDVLANDCQEVIDMRMNKNYIRLALGA